MDFFIFFAPSSSPHYEDPRFQIFCGACADVRARFPALTLSALRTFLSVASQDIDGVTYEEVAACAGLEYIQAAHHIEQLSDGRAGFKGLGLLARREANDRRHRIVALTDLGREIAQRFVKQNAEATSSVEPQACAADLANELAKATFPAIKVAADALPGIALGTFTVLLEIVRQEALFGYHGRPANAVAEQLGISNFARHLGILGCGFRDRQGFRVIELVPHPHDRRIKLPRVTADGHRLVSEIAGRVCGEQPVVPRRAKTQRLAELEGPDAVSDLSDCDFDPSFDAG